MIMLLVRLPLTFRIALLSLLTASAVARQAPKGAAELLGAMTLSEKISQLGYNSPAVDRLGIPAYVWWNEALHGVARGGEATVFPQAIGLGATFDPALAREVADAIGTEARAKFNLATATGRRGQYLGLTFWTPNINIDRDPRWGRGQETYGEDPYLTGAMGAAFIRGLQGDDPRWMKAAACAKHFAVHSGPEATRHTFDARVGERDLRETYLPAFLTAVGAGVEAVMCAYNRVNGQPCCTGTTLLGEILRSEWGFRGHVVTDCWALDDIWLRHKAIPTRLETAVAAVKAGVNLDCANILQEDVAAALAQGLLTESDVDSAVAPLLRTRAKLGLLGAGGALPFQGYGRDSIRNAGHVALARRAARESMVLLKNNGVLPLDRSKLASLLVTGPSASSLDALLGNYHGIGGDLVTFAEGIAAAAGPSVAVQYDAGCDDADTVHFGGVWASSMSDATVAVLGLTPLVEGEDGDAFLSASGGDRTSLRLPRAQVAFLKALRAASNRPLVVILTGGGALDVAEIEPLSDAVLLAWYPGEQGGAAAAELLFGDASPSGRLPVTFYRSTDDLPPFDDYAMAGRTYRYFSGTVLHPFGFGLGYATFSYRWEAAPRLEAYAAGDTVRCAVTVENKSAMAADEVVQLYVSSPAEGAPRTELKAFARVTIPPGASVRVPLSVPVDALKHWDANAHAWALAPGSYRLRVAKNALEGVLETDVRVR
jgi:beta-glucosidase